MQTNLKQHSASLFFLLLFAVITSRPAQAQSAGMSGSGNVQFYIGLNAGVLTNLTDITQTKNRSDREERRWGSGWFFDAHLTPWGSASLRFMTGHLAGQRGTRSFVSSLTEVTLNGRLRVNMLVFPDSPLNSWLSLYSVTGVGFVHYDTRRYEGEVLRFDEPGVALAMPLGVGVGFHLGIIQDRFRIDFLLEFVNRLTTTDLIDGFESRKNDAYNYVSFGMALGL